jgi:hypothetical protein
MFDPSTIQSDSHKFNPVTPNGEILKDVTITIRSSFHPKVKEINNLLELEEDNREKMLARKGRKASDPQTEEDLLWRESVINRRIASRVESIVGLSDGGKEVGNDVALISGVISKYEWIALQVIKESAEPTNFFRGRDKPST